MFDPNLVLVAAVAENGVIGREGHLPWRLPSDLKRFRELTMGKTLLMGRKTFVSLGKPLAGRRNWVLTRDAAFTAPPEVRIFGALDPAVTTHRELHSEEDLMVIGGADIYRQTLAYAGRIELTRVAAAFDGDARFPTLDLSEWEETGREDHGPDAKHAVGYQFLSLRRR